VLPIPTPSALYAFSGAAFALILSAMVGSPIGLVVSGGMLLGLALVFTWSIPVGRRVRRQKLEFAWWLAHGEPGSDAGAATPNKPFEVRCFLRHRGGQALSLRAMEALVPGGARILDDEPDAVLTVPAGTRTEFSFRLVAPATGRVVLHGLAVRLGGPLGLFEVPLYFPNPLIIKVLPQAASMLRGTVRALSGPPVERAGASLMASGGGTELKELRDMQPSDSFRSIAWKPSARRGKLLVREVEQEVQETRCVILDVSGTMRGGEPGKRKLDFIIETTAAEARRTLRQGDQFGLVTVDGRVLTNVAPRDGNAQLLRVFDALFAATEVVDADLTDADDEDVVSIVGRYVRQQDGIDFRTKRGDWNLTLLAKHVTRALELSKEDERGATAVAAQTPAGVLLRRFCLLRGIPLTHRADPRGGAKAASLAQALHGLAGSSRAPMSIALVTDLDGIGDPEPLLQAIKLLRGRGHAIVMLVPDAASFHPRPKTAALQGQLWDIYVRGESRRLADMTSLLVPLGVRVAIARASDSPVWSLSRAIEGARRSRAA
jgi:uncharacterized protein (DUF58 family)